MPTDIISLTEFKNDASGWIERLQNQPPVVLTQNGRGKAVVQSYESYRQQRYAVAVLQRVIRGQADALAGRTVPHEIVGFIATQSPLTARRVAARLAAAAAPLRRLPHRGPRVPELSVLVDPASLAALGLEIRELLVGPWRLTYVIERRAVRIAAVVDSRRDMVAWLERHLGRFG